MYAQNEKQKENRSRAVANSFAHKKSNVKQHFSFVDNRPESVAQRKLQEMTNNAPQVKQLMTLPPIQRMIKLKWTIDGQNTNMSGPDLKTEVNRLIEEGKPGEILDAIGALKTSISTRTNTKVRYDKIGYRGTYNARKHEIRIKLEKSCRDALQAKRDRDLKSRPAKHRKMPDAEGWITV